MGSGEYQIQLVRFDGKYFTHLAKILAIPTIPTKYFIFKNRVSHETPRGSLIWLPSVSLWLLGMHTQVLMLV